MHNKVYVVMGCDSHNEPYVERVFSAEDKAVDYVISENYNSDWYKTVSYEEKKKNALSYFVQEHILDLA